MRPRLNLRLESVWHPPDDDSDIQIFGGHRIHVGLSALLDSSSSRGLPHKELSTQEKLVANLGQRVRLKKRI